ncbi:hypothetical protein HMPREF0201_03619 [Cedecea davisae DSM 4568]|uniref:Uncharacterized protein n=1 Tax=Cedecea davisae DSM 4568 TaxID=566551 RepID=S3J4L6_9ENTR|nr:hypothetical protein HMPREF0201_03619 [Cedecea davisae DSM 4568]
MGEYYQHRSRMNFYSPFQGLLHFCPKKTHFYGLCNLMFT